MTSSAMKPSFSGGPGGSPVSLPYLRFLRYCVEAISQRWEYSAQFPMESEIAIDCIRHNQGPIESGGHRV
jgi:hypothetical protein